MQNDPLPHVCDSLTPNDGAPQQRALPRPLPAFLKMLRSEAGDDAARITAVLAGVRRYQQAERQPSEGNPREIARVGRARLLGYGGTGAPVVLVPSLINGSEILDLDADRSLLRWLTAQGFRAMLVDWGNPVAEEATLDLGGHVTELLDPLLDKLEEPPVLVGYCLGGTIALAAATLRRPRALGLIATPWNYDGFPEASRDDLGRIWAEVAAQARAIGLMPMEVLQLVFWSLDPQRTLAKFAAFGVRDDVASLRSFVPVEDWANDGPPMTYAAARELMDDLFETNLPGRGRWQVGGKLVTPTAIDVPMLEIVSTTDRIVPAAAAAGAGQRLQLAMGHVGMIVGRHARYAVWAPLADWLRSV